MLQRVIQSRNSLSQVRQMMDVLDIRAPLLIAGDRMAEVFSAKTGLNLPVFSGFHPNPDLQDALAGADMFRAKGCDGLISIGGGSAMDTAKAVKALLLADLPDVMVSRLPDDAQLPHIAIPGTAGTGAEATPIAVVYVNDEKLSLDHPALLPEGVILDGSLLDTLPDYHRKACAFDALCQGVESYWAQKATQESRVHAVRAIQGVVKHIDAYLRGDADAQNEMLLAAYESGCAIRISRTTAAHAMSYQITKRLGYAHGHACMLTLPHLWRHLLESADKRPLLEELAQIIGLTCAADAPEFFLNMLSSTGMQPQSKPDDALLDALAASVNVQRLGNHPEKLDAAQLRAIYAEALC